MNVKDKSILITGAGGGLGSVMANLLADNGAQVFILDLDAEKGQATADAICAKGQRAWFFLLPGTGSQDDGCHQSNNKKYCGEQRILRRSLKH